jgi:hypothetical protein
MQLTLQWITTTFEWTQKASFHNLYILEASQFFQYISGFLSLLAGQLVSAKCGVSRTRL